MVARFLLLVSVLPACLSSAQTEGPGLPEGFRRAQVYVEIWETGTEESVVDVAFLDRDYPQAKIAEHLTVWRNETGQHMSAPKVEVHEISGADNRTEKIVHVRFTTRGLVNKLKGTMDLQSIVRAFHEFSDLDIRLYMRDFLYRGYGTFESEAVGFTALVEPGGAHFMVHIGRHDPAAIIIPALYQPTPKPEEREKPKRPPVGLYVSVAVAVSVAAGGLVYYLLRHVQSR